jgi:hypothetical protein
MSNTLTDSVTEAKLDHYAAISAQALKKARVAAPERTDLNQAGVHIVDMARRYISDAQHFRKNGDYVNAFACLNYAHGWLDAGAALGLLDVDHDSRLFTVD